MKRGCLFWNARARNTHVEATLNLSRPAQAHPLEPALALEKCGATMSAVLRRTLAERTGRTVTYGGETREVPPEIALVASKAAIERPPTRAPAGGATLAATCLRLRGRIKGVVLDGAELAARGDAPECLAWLAGRGARAAVANATGRVDLPDAAYPVVVTPRGVAEALAALAPLAPGDVLLVTASEASAAVGRDAGAVVCALLPPPDGAAAAAPPPPGDRARGLSWFADDGDAGAPPPAPAPPGWASDRSLAHFAASSLAGLRRLVH